MKKKQFLETIFKRGFDAAFNLLIKDGIDGGIERAKEYVKLFEAKKKVKDYLDKNQIKAANELIASIAKLPATGDEVYVRVVRHANGETVEAVRQNNIPEDLFENDALDKLADDKFEVAKAAADTLFNTLKSIGVTLVFDREYESFGFVSGPVKVVYDQKVDQSPIRSINIPSDVFLSYNTGEHQTLAKADE